MGGSAFRFGAREALWLTLAAAYGLALYWNLPGHLTTDSVLALREGRLEVRDTWNPALFGWLLGLFDRVVRGTSLYVVVASLVLFGGWAALALLRPRVSWLAPPVAAALALLPQVLIYQGIVWKDVLFANMAVATFVLLAFAVRGAPAPRGWGWLAAAALTLAMAGLFRQNGLILLAPAVLVLVWTGWRSGPARSLGLAAGWAVAVGLLTLLLASVAQPQGAGAPDTAGSRGVRILQHYDIAGAAALDPAHPLPHIDRANPAADDTLRERAALAYSPDRVDKLSADEILSGVFWRLPDEAVRAEWLDLITERPGAYLGLRSEVFRWVVATPVIDACLPVAVGVQGPPQALDELGLAFRQDLRDRRLFNYTTWFLDTPAMSHLTYGALAILVAGLLLIRREPADIAMVGLLAGALLFAASFFVISIACDYRYLYVLDVAAITGLLYLAMDPRLKRRAD